VRCLTTINRTNVAIEIDGRPRSRAEHSHARSTGLSSAGSRSTRSSRAKSPGNSHTPNGKHLVPQTLHLTNTKRQHHTSNRRENPHKQAESS
jgi:hypothetical protein